VRDSDSFNGTGGRLSLQCDDPVPRTAPWHARGGDLKIASAVFVAHLALLPKVRKYYDGCTTCDECALSVHIE
jgi:hypothetical protein